MHDGIHFDISHAEYLRLNDRAAYGVLRAAQKCPAKAISMLGAKDDRSASRGNRIGRGAHCAILEPLFFREYEHQRCMYKPTTKDGDRKWCSNGAVVRTTPGEWYCAKHVSMQNEDVDVEAPATAIQEEIDCCKGIQAAYKAHSGVKELLSKAERWNYEVSLLWTDKGLPLKCRPDAVSSDRHIVFDLKTVSSANPISVAREAIKRGSLHQAAMTRLACRALGHSFESYYIVALEADAPFCVSVCEVDDRDIDHAESDLRDGIERLRESRDTGIWPGYEGIHSLRLPSSAWELSSDAE